MSAARILCVLLLGCIASGCGFRPLYGTNGHVGATLSSIYVEPISDKLGYDFRNTLIEALGSSGHAGGTAYRLQIAFNTKSEGIAIQSDASITRYNDTLTVKYTLTDATGALVTSGTETGLSAYNVVSSPYATLVEQQDADRRAADDIAERIRIDLAIFFARGGHAKPAAAPAAK